MVLFLYDRQGLYNNTYIVYKSNSNFAHKHLVFNSIPVFKYLQAFTDG